MNAKKNNKDRIYMYMYGGFKQFCLPFLEFQGP